MIFGLVMLVVVPIVLYVVGFGVIVRVLKVSTFALVRTIGMNKRSLIVCAAVVALYLLTYGEIHGAIGTILTLVTIPCACLLWWFGIRWVMDNSNNITNWIDKWNNALSEETKRTRQRRREQDNKACEMFDQGYRDIVNHK